MFDFIFLEQKHEEMELWNQDENYRIEINQEQTYKVARVSGVFESG